MGEQVKKRSEIAEEFKWNLEDMIPSKEALDELLEEIDRGISLYASYKGRLGSSKETLREYLLFDETMDERFSRLFSYASQKSDEDTAVGEYQALLSKAGTLAARAAAAAAFVEPELLSIPDQTMKEFLQSEELSHYRLKLSRILAKKPHMLSEAEEQLLARAAEMAQTADHVFRLFNNADLRFPRILDGNGQETEVTHARYGTLLESADRRVRKDAFQSYYSAYTQFANTLAAAYEGNLKQACFYAKSRKYSSTRAYYLGENEIPELVYDNLVKTVNERLPLLHRYMGLRKKALGLQKLHMYDLYVPMTAGVEKQYSYEEAKALLLEGLKPLGEEYLDLLRTGFANRWIDVYENQGKRSGAYSNCTYGVHPYVLMSYDGTLNSVLTLAHEMGHSLHSWYSNHAQTFTYADYRIFVAEVASTCNEVLLLRYLMEKAESREEKRYLINQLLERFRTTLYRQTMFAQFEWESHKLAWDGTPLTKETLCGLYHDLNAKYYGPDVEVDQEIDHEWERIPHFYRPFYVYQYATGFSAATAIAGRILAGDQKTLSGYFDFLKGGCSGTPVELLKLCGLDMEKPMVVEEALDVFETLLTEMEQA